MWTKEIEDCLSKLTKEEERVLKRTILKGSFGDDSCRFRNILGDISKEETRCWVYLTNPKYALIRRFYYKKDEEIFKSIRAKLCPIDDYGRFFVYQKEWWGENTSDIIRVPEDIHIALEQWADDGIDKAAHCPINEKDIGIDELLEDLFNDGHYSWNKDNTEKVGFVGNEPILVRQETDNKLLVRFLGDAWCPDVVEEWVKRIEHDKNNDVDYVIDSYMFGVIENDRERKSNDFHVSFYYRG
ncbi:hypothetical protein [Segatella copri]|uniref:hypothetical protein n=1 Tax=Segatella copri TaxID=165179 RepID=UPI0012910729|nr:hypothetical protein [Segatella copri]MQM90235.1 hypothetical protein [Segatella copri]MQM95845.1 hypothetical protein [Segatella copri]MQN03887.1 hypothetical protein [Segatella copri]MQN16113.1 hypothetical protein [Segatella copri]MQN18270.1 hypothetical protein [Segatella copri]